MQLVGGNTELEGRVKVCLGGQWGGVCGGGWGSAEAEVVCKQLQFSAEGELLQ